MGMLNFQVESLGCKVNQYEAEALREGLRGLGLRPAASPGGADLVVVNTCSVTGHAGATSRKLVRRALRSNPGATVLVTGCYAESDRERLLAIPGVSRVFGNGEKERLIAYVAGCLPDFPEGQSLPPFRIKRLGRNTRAFVKIEDGCDDRCSFCIIPKLRGPARSRPEHEILQEVRNLVQAGHREVVLTGVHLGYYGKESGRRSEKLFQLLEQLSRLPGLGRLKLSSIEVNELNDVLLDLLAGRPVFAPHFHLPLQSGSDRVLKRMRRRYTSALFAGRVEAIRARFARPALSTDVIVGFPGESAAEFQETLDFVARMGFMKVHVFPYSPRVGTVAAKLAGRLPEELLEERKRRLMQLGQQLFQRFGAGFLGTQARVLVEGRRHKATGWLTGLSERYLRVVFEGADGLRGRILPCKLEALLPSGVFRGRRVLGEGAP